MLQLAGLILISWILIWLFTKGNLSVLGLTPTIERIKYFMLLFIVSGIISASTFLLKSYYILEQYTLANNLTLSSFLKEIWYQFRMVLTEELICRGAILYILIKKIGPTKAIIISSLFFAILHWINSTIWGNVTQMAIVFTFTFAMGLLLAFSYARTFSLIIPFAIHFGWNLTQNYIFPDSANGNHVFVQATTPPEVTISYLAFFTLLLLPKISVLSFNYLIIKRHRQVEIP